MENKMSPYDAKIWTKSYDKHVKPSLSYPTDSLGILFDKAMKKYPDRIACYFMEREMTFQELDDYVHRFATFLQKNGLKKGDRVAINLANCPQYLVAHFGTLLVGGVASGCSPLMSPTEIAYQINDSEAKFFVTLDAFYEKVLTKVLDKVPNLETIITTNISDYMGLSGIKVALGKLIGKIPKGKVIPYPAKNVLDFNEVIKTEDDVDDVKIDSENDLALLQYTGGTTGLPKGTELTHKNIISNIVQISTWIDRTEEEQEDKVNLSAFPLFHLAGLAMSMVTLYLSASQILIANPRDSDHIIKEMMDKKPMMMVNVPTLYLAIKNRINEKWPVEKIPRDVLNDIEVFISGAAPFPAEAINDFESSLVAKNKVLEVYGMTETSPIISMNPYYGKKKIGTVGIPVPDIEVRLVDVETGDQVELGKPGEIICKGPQVTRGYYNKPDANSKTIIDGWFHTGDVGVMDEDGYITIVDRTKDMLIVSGYKVYSVHVEDILTKHPNIEMVAIIGLKDPDRPGSETVKAVVQLKEGFEPTNKVKTDLKNYAAEHLSKYENPRLWEFRETLPLTTVGKILKRALREESTN
ncbi:MAG: AMP-binding protein [Candidatus Lokiarchaeota archaeon]|nr:AMP-binding protein [Candidatus Lokiarchaeota archaeon]